jgi:DNA-binding response OmpR family regulator
MESTSPRCLLVASEFGPAARLAARASNEQVAEVVMAPTLGAARRLLERDRFDLVAAHADLPDGPGLSLLDSAPRDADIEFFMLGAHLSKYDVLTALRRGARDVFEEPFDDAAIVARWREALRRQQKRRHERRRQRRLRQLSSRIIRDRREVRKRVDIVCRDLVGAYRQLAEKVVSLGDAPLDGEAIDEN